ncbi:MAG: VanZ family protein [Ruminococcus flavefaciens]
MKRAQGIVFNKRIIAIMLTLLHIAVVLYITLIDRIPGERRHMLTPFWEIRNVINGTERSFYIGQIIGNLLMLFPTGFLLPAIFKCKKIRWYHVASTALLFSLFIEITQYFTGRGLMEFDDVFNNTVGCLIGYAVYLMIRRRVNNRK